MLPPAGSLPSYQWWRVRAPCACPSCWLSCFISLRKWEHRKWFWANSNVIESPALLWNRAQREAARGWNIPLLEVKVYFFSSSPVLRNEWMGVAVRLSGWRLACLPSCAMCVWIHICPWLCLAPITFSCCAFHHIRHSEHQPKHSVTG